MDTEVGKWMYEMGMRYPLSKSKLVHDMVYLLHVVSSCSYAHAMLVLVVSCSVCACHVVLLVSCS